MLKLGVKKYSESTQLVSKDKIYGSVQSQIDEFIKDNEIKDAELRIKDEVNAANTGHQMMFIIREIDATKPKDELLTSDDVMLSKTMSDAIRTGELHTSALKQFIVVEHENNTNGAIYPLMVRPQDVERDDSSLNKFSVSSKAKVTKAYKRDETTVKSTIAKFNF